MDALLQTPAAQAAMLAAAGALAFWLKDIPGLLVSWVKRFFISTLTLDSRDEFLFSSLVEYMDAHPSLRQVNQFTARSVRQGTSYQSLEEDLRAGQAPRAYLSPGEGLHILWVDGAPGLDAARGAGDAKRVRAHQPVAFWALQRLP